MPFNLADSGDHTHNGGGNDLYLAKLSADGNSLIYGTYLGGNGDDAGFAIAVDGAGNAYVTGSTDSENFTSANALQPNPGGSQNVFFAKINSSRRTS